MKCAACGHENNAGARFCANCGQALAGVSASPSPSNIPSGIRCPNCGVQNRPGVRFCENCGAAMVRGYVAPASRPAASSSGWRGCGIAGAVIVVGIILCLLVGGAFAAFYLWGNGGLAAPVPSPVAQVVIFTATLPQELQAPMPVQPAAAEPTATLRPTEAGLPPSTATLGPPMFTADKNSFCRKGPSTVYEDRTSIDAGNAVKILGKSGPGWEDWWYVEVSGSKCWVWSGLGTTSGDLSNLPIIQAPPTPTPTNTPVVLPQTCTGTEGYGPIVVGSQVILEKHRVINGSDNWTSPDMDAFVGQTATVTKLSGYDSQNCPGVRIDLDGGKWFWRIRDLKLP